MLNRRSRRPEAGQVLIAALAFIALLALLGGATLTFMSSAQLQDTKGEAATYQRALVEGAAGYAFADLTRPGAAFCTGGAHPSGVIGGSVKVASTQEQLSYTVNSCYENGAGGGGSGSGIGCFLCILTTGAVSFDDNKSTVTVDVPPDNTPGSIGAVVNGSATFSGGPGGQLCVQRITDGALCPLNVGIAGRVNGASPPATMGSGGSATTAVTAISDPFQNTFSAPSLAGIDHGDVTTATGPPIVPGIYDNISISSGDLNLDPGTYIITQSMQISGGGSIQGVGVTIYLACHGASGAVACPASSPATASSIENFCGHLPAIPSQAYLSAFGSGSGGLTLTAPTEGPYAGLAVFADRNNSAGVCIAGNGTTTLTGAVYGRSAGLNIQGNGIQGQLGSVVVGAVGIHVSTAANGLKLTSTGTGPGVFGCDLIDASVTGAGEWTDGKTYTGSGRVVFQTNCDGGNGVISLSYAP